MYRRNGIERVLALALWLVGCGAPAAKPAEGPKPNSEASTHANPQPEPGAAKLAAQQRDACEKMCQSFTACAMVDLKANWDQLSGEDRKAAESIGERELQANTDQCRASCEASELSPRQVKVVRDCLTDMPAKAEPSAAQCNTFQSCLGAAQKQ
jgi:hypothetical protein